MIGQAEATQLNRLIDEAGGAAELIEQIKHDRARLERVRGELQMIQRVIGVLLGEMSK